MESVKYLVLASAWALVFASCEKPPAIPPAAQDFLPAVAHMKEGVLHEYLTRYDQGPNKEVQGQIEYSLYKISPNGKEVSISGLTPALAPLSLTLLQLSNSTFTVKQSENYYRTDTFSREIGDSELLRLDGKAASLHFSNDYWTSTRTLRQVADTTWREMPAKRFVGKEFSHALSSGKRDTAQLEKLYVAGLGLTFSRTTTATSEYSRELVRQLSPKQHAELKATVPKRVAYIDAENTLIPDQKDWAPCRADVLIYDYYNPTPDIGYPGGHYALKRDVLPQINLTAFAAESGYLTIRFVINCEGEVGRFTTDEADLNFKPKDFPAEAVKELALAIQKLENWDTGRARDTEPLGDFYTYITLKFEDGKLIDLLP